MSINNSMKYDINKGNKFVIYQDSQQFVSVQDFANSEFYNTAVNLVNSYNTEFTVTPIKVGNFYVVHILAPFPKDIENMNAYMFQNKRDVLKWLHKHQLHTPWDSHGGSKYDWIEKLERLPASYDGEYDWSATGMGYDIFGIPVEFENKKQAEKYVAQNIHLGNTEYTIILCGYYWCVQVFADSQQQVDDLTSTLSDSLLKVPPGVVGLEKIRWIKSQPRVNPE